MAISLIGKNGFLFLDGDFNRVQHQITGKKKLQPSDVDIWNSELASRDSYCKNKNIIYHFIVIPNKECVYSENLINVNISDDRPALQIGNSYTYYHYDLGLFKKYKSDHLIYHKTDTHWNRLGCVLYFNYLSKLFCANKLDFNVYCEEIIGDLGSKVTPCLRSRTNNINFNSNTVKIYDNQIRNVGHELIYVNKNKNLKSCCCFGDSFSADFLDIISQYFSVLYFFHSPLVFDIDIINKISPDIVLNITIERFIDKPYFKTFKQSFEDKFYTPDYRKALAECKTINYDNRLSVSGLDYYYYLLYYFNVFNSTSKSSFFYKRHIELMKDFPVVRKFSNLWWFNNKKLQFKCWGVVFHIKNHQVLRVNINEIVFYLANLHNLTNIELGVWLFEDFLNIPLLDLRKMSCIFCKSFNINEFNLSYDYGEVKFTNLCLDLFSNFSYLITIKSDTPFGIGKSFQDLVEDEYCFRGYFGTGDELHSVYQNESIAFTVS